MADVGVIQPAEIPARPITPRKGRNILLGMLLGAGIGLGPRSPPNTRRRVFPHGNRREAIGAARTHDDPAQGLTGPCTSISIA